MAEYIIPGGGGVNDTTTGSEVVIPGFGIYNEQVIVSTGKKWFKRKAGMINIFFIIEEEEWH